MTRPEESCFELAIASPIDLGLMKFGAIISRGTRWLTRSLAWNEVEKWLNDEVRKLGRQRIGLA